MSAKYADHIQALYIAYFNRPADVDGIHYWESVNNKTAISQNVRNAYPAEQIATPHWVPDAKQARRDQIRRNGGKR